MNYKIGAARKMTEKKQLCEELLADLRAVDKKEIEGMGISSAEGVRVSIYETSPVYYARDMEGKLILCWGLQVLMFPGKNTYLIWALGTDRVKKHKKAFMRESRALLNRWRELYGELTNTVATFNQDAIGWLKWLGAEFSPPYKIGDTEYMDFYLRKKG